MIQGSKSEWAPVTSSIPQGSVLGPTLFTLFVNDMPLQVSSCVKLFADDTKLYRRVTGRTADLQADIDTLVEEMASSIQQRQMQGDSYRQAEPRTHLHA